MALSGQYTTLDTILARLQRDTKTTIDEADAIEWVTEVLARIAPQSVLKEIITDGNPDEGHPIPVRVENYRAKFPCDLVEFKYAFELDHYKKLRPSMNETHRVNMNKTKNAGRYAKYTPDFFAKQPHDEFANYYREGTYQVKNGYIYTDFPDGYLILIYLGWPMDENENLLIPADEKVIRGLVSTLQYKADYQAWRNGDLADKVFNDSEQNMHFDVASAQTHIIMPSEDEMYTINNFLRKSVRNDNFFNTHFSSVGTPDKYRTHNG